jgi:hypothetical protein
MVPLKVTMVASMGTRRIVVVIASIATVTMALAIVTAGGACMGRCWTDGHEHDRYKKS